MSLRTITAAQIEAELITAIGRITFNPDPAIAGALATAFAKESSELGSDVLSTLQQNLVYAREDSIPICQDTGTLVVFAEMGSELLIAGPPLQEIVDTALTKATKQFYLRTSILQDPLYKRVNTANNAPAILHLRQVQGNSLLLKIAQKGGGAENMSRLKMFTPSATEDDIVCFAMETVILAGAKACPPLVLGIGIGGNFESCALLAKEALLQPLLQANPDNQYAKLERKILAELNASGIGAQGMGGDCTALAVHILVAPCHIASLPVAVNLQCHAHRHCELKF